MEKKKDYAFEFSDYQKHRSTFVPGCPSSLIDPINQKIKITNQSFPVQEQFKSLFPTLLSKDMPYLEIQLDTENGTSMKSETPLKLAVVLSGGQAAGGHNVIMGVFDMIKKMNPESQLYGFLMGPRGVYSNKYIEINAEYMQLYRNMGGFDMICSGRDKIETAEQFEASLKNCAALDLDGLVVIGGDDSNTNACLLAEYFEKHSSKCKVIGCPKTIDGDLKNEHIEVSFGFDTATKTYSEAIGNLCVDALSSKLYYYFVRLMGRSASHIALECALNTRVNYVVIGEEVEKNKQTLSEITHHIADIICKRQQMGKNYGVILVPEGLIEFIPEIKKLISQINEILSKPFQGDIREHVMDHLTFETKALFSFMPRSIADQLLLDRDPHGNVQVSKIDTERLLILLLGTELERRQKRGDYSGIFTPQAHFFGYEGRCALPSNFDSQYCYSLGLNAALLIKIGATGYISCIKNLADPDPLKWIPAGCPLPTMMNVERRKGKDLPVIKKALVDLDGEVFQSYAAVREKWAILDCYTSPGPIQFKSNCSKAINFLVKPPNKEALVKLTDEHEKFELEHAGTKSAFRDINTLSDLSLLRITEKPLIPETLESGDYVLVGIKKHKPFSQLVKSKIDEQFHSLNKETTAQYFVEVQDRLMAKQLHHVRGTGDSLLDDLNTGFFDRLNKKIKIGVLYLGSQAPGGNNIIDGLLRYQAQRGDYVTLLGFVDGMKGLAKENIMTITEESYQYFRNMGGYDYLGKAEDAIRTQAHLTKALEMCQKLDLAGLILVGATHTLTDGAYLADFLLTNNCQTRVVVIPATVDGNIHHSYVATSLGFDTAAKIYSQQVGNMLTDSASAIKYWYFIRLMGRDPSHLVLEVALQTHPNIVIISEECSQRGESLIDIVNRICDVISERANQNKNYGCVLIPEGLLNHISAYKSLIEELSDLFAHCKDRIEAFELAQQLFDSEAALKEKLTPWSFSLFITIPDFIKKQILFEREVHGSVKLAQIETEKLMAYLVDEELKRRKKLGKYKGSFAPVTHYFGYQGRCSHPTPFDCSLGSTYGFTAGILIENGLTGYTVTAQQVTGSPLKWRVGGVPLLSMLRSQPKSGYKRSDLVIPSDEVDLYGETYQRMKAVERSWRYIDHYSNPGPIQFFDHGRDTVAFTLKCMFAQKTKVCEQINAICQSIQNDCLFVEHSHLLIAAFSSLESAKSVINSMTASQSLGGNIE